MTTVDVHALGGAYALDATSELERVAFQRHLSGCEACRTELAELRETAARLADTAWSVPPPGLRERVLAEVRRTRQVPPAIPAESASSRRQVGWGRRAALAAAAAVLVAGGGIAGYQTQQGRVARERDAAQVARDRTAAIEAVLSSPDVRLRSSPVRTGGRLTVAASAKLDQAVLLPSGLAALAPGRIYQLWLIQGTTPTSAGVLPSAPVLLSAVRGMAALAVTVEPAGGSPAPTSTEIVSIPL